LRILGSIFILFMAIACGDVNDARPGPGPDANRIQSGPLEGSVFGQYWQAVDGKAELRRGDSDYYLIYITDYDVEDICNPITPITSGILFTLPTSPEKYELGPKRPLSFFVGNSSSTSIEGLIDFQGIDFRAGKRFLKAGLRASDENGNIVNGQFEVRVCE